MRIPLALAATALATGCASIPPAPINSPATPDAMAEREPSDFGIEGDTLVLAFSGGGARAAAFSFGVLEGLREMPAAEGGQLIDQVSLVSAVSGGSLTAAYFGLHGSDIEGFRDAYLYNDSSRALDTSVVSPLNWLRAAEGGVNDSARLAGWLDSEIYKGATVRDLWTAPGPRVWLNATDLYHGTQFAFSQTYFDAVCAPLAPVRIADAAAASMAVPIGFRPVVLEIDLDACAPLPRWVEHVAADRRADQLLRSTARAFLDYRDPGRMKYVHLLDGGVTDNLGLTSLLTIRRSMQTPFGPFSARDGVQLRRLTFLVVNAELVETENWALEAHGPDGAETASATVNSLMNSGKRGAYDAWADMMAEWERDIINWRCSLRDETIAELGADPATFDCRDVSFTLDMISFRDLPDALRDKLGSAATAVTLDRALTDELIAGGRQAVLENEAARALGQAPPVRE